VRTFRMGRTEATVGQFRRFVEATGYRTDAEKNPGDNDGCLTLGSDPEFGWHIQIRYEPRPLSATRGRQWQGGVSEPPR